MARSTGIWERCAPAHRVVLGLALGAAAGLLGAAGCVGDNPGAPGTGGAAGTGGGAAGTGGASATGGASGTGGLATGTGGAGTGGMSAPYYFNATVDGTARRVEMNVGARVTLAVMSVSAGATSAGNRDGWSLDLPVTTDMGPIAAYTLTFRDGQSGKEFTTDALVVYVTKPAANPQDVLEVTFDSASVLEKGGTARHDVTDGRIRAQRAP